MEMRYDTDNLIYNRYDILYSESAVSEEYYDGQNTYKVLKHEQDGVVEFNIWGKSFPDAVFGNMISNAFRNKKIYAVKVTRGRNQYGQFLEETNDVRVPLPDSFDELMNRAERRDRATIRRKLRWLDERVGELKVDVFQRDNIPDSVVEKYFEWKKETHGTEYCLLPKEYLDKYYVTDAMFMRAGNTDVAVAFFCQVEDIVFFENFSYNSSFKEYSPGLLMYVKFMEELINRKCKFLYLGGGSYVYKKRFGAESSTAFSGMIYRPEIVAGLNAFFDNNSIQNISFYGYGVCGHTFYQLSHNLKLNVQYGIDKKEYEEDEIIIISPERRLPEVDAVIITLNNKNAEVEELLKEKVDKVFYWNDILDEIISDYRRGKDEST